MPHDHNEPGQTWLSTSEAAERAGVSVRTLYRYEAAGAIAATRLPSGHRRFKAEDIDAMSKAAS